MAQRGSKSPQKSPESPPRFGGGAVLEPGQSEVRTGRVLLELCDDHPENYNYHPPSQIEELRVSFRLFGQVDTIIVWERPDGRFWLVGGHGVTAAARLEGYTELESRIIPAGWSPEKVKGYLAVANESARGSVRDEAQLASILADAKSFDERVLQAAGFSDQEFDELLNSMGGGEAAVQIKPVNVPPPPKMTWVLLGIPTVLYGRIAAKIEAIATDPDVIVEMTVGNGEEN